MLNEIEIIKERADQLWKNFVWLMGAMDALHILLCPGQTGTWQERTAQVVAKIIKLDREGKLL